jgi:hypothetical protein
MSGGHALFRRTLPFLLATAAALPWRFFAPQTASRLRGLDQDERAAAA